MIPYEILIRGNESGEFQGAHVIDEPNGLPRKVTQADIQAIAPSINAAALVEFGKVQALESFKAEMVAKVSAALASGKLDELQAIAVDFLTPEEEKARAAKLAQLEALKAELGID